MLDQLVLLTHLGATSIIGSQVSSRFELFSHLDVGYSERVQVSPNKSRSSGIEYEIRPSAISEFSIDTQAGSGVGLEEYNISWVTSTAVASSSSVSESNTSYGVLRMDCFLQHNQILWSSQIVKHIQVLSMRVDM